MARLDRRLILLAARKALEKRLALGIKRHQPISPIDISAKLGAQVWFRDVRSYDGVYLAGGPPLIVLSSLRPLGRISFTCAHELGHHVFGHATSIDQLENELDFSVDDDELVANAFAAHFLMPRSVIMHGFKVRGISPAESTPLDIMCISSWLGVGYSTLINHLLLQLNAISSGKAKNLKKGQPKRLKEELTGSNPGIVDVICVDKHWEGRPVDCRIDDYIFALAEFTATKPLVEDLTEINGGRLYRAVRAGSSSCIIGSTRGELRISRRGWTGRAIYRHEEDADD